MKFESGKIQRKNSRKSGTIALVACAALAGANLVVGCASKTDPVQTATPAPAVTSTPVPAPVVTPPPSALERANAHAPGENEDRATPYSNLHFLRPAFERMPELDGTLQYDDGYSEPIIQPITFGIGMVSPSKDVSNVFVHVESFGELGEIVFSRYVDVLPTSRTQIYGNIRRDTLVLRSHLVEIPTLEYLKPGFRMDSPIMPFAFELRLAVRDGKQVDPAQSRIRILGCGSSRCSAEKVPPGITLKLNKGRR